MPLKYYDWFSLLCSIKLVVDNWYDIWMGGLEDQVEENVEKQLYKIIEIMRKRNVEGIYSGALNTYNKSSY